MHKLLVLYSHPASAADFQRYYTDTHLPLAAQLPGLKASRHAFGVDAVGVPSPYFGLWEGEFDSAEAMGAAMGSEIGRAVAADVANYATGGALVLHYSPISG